MEPVQAISRFGHSRTDHLLGGRRSADLGCNDSRWQMVYRAHLAERRKYLPPTIPFPILRIPLAGGTPETILQLSRQGSVSCARPPSSICVLAHGSEDGKQMIVSILDPIKGRGSELVRFDFDATCVISPDGTRLAMWRSPESPLEIRSLHGRLIHEIPSRSVGELIWLNWSTDQKGFFATRKGKSGNELLYLDFQGKATSLRKCGGGTNGLGGGCEGLPSPDGRHLAITDRDQSNNMWMMENF